MLESQFPRQSLRNSAVQLRRKRRKVPSKAQHPAPVLASVTQQLSSDQSCLSTEQGWQEKQVQALRGSPLAGSLDDLCCLV